jgi:hypothetical protein
LKDDVCPIGSKMAVETPLRRGDGSQVMILSEMGSNKIYWKLLAERICAHLCDEIMSFS